MSVFAAPQAMTGARGAARKAGPRRDPLRWTVALVALGAGVLTLAQTPGAWRAAAWLGAAAGARGAVLVLAAILLWAMDGRAAHWVVRGSALVVVVLLLAARAVAPIEVADPLDVAPGQALDLALTWVAVAALALGLPFTAAGTGPRRFPTGLVVVLGGLFALAGLWAGGMFFFDPTVDPSSPALSLGLETPSSLSPLSDMVPAVEGTIAGRLSFYLPWASTGLVLVTAAGMALALGWTVQLAGWRRTCPQRWGLLGAAPAVVAAPLCCGPALISFAGIPVLAAVGAMTDQLLLAGAALALVNAAWVRWSLQRARARGAAEAGPR
jgi:hypothetical protein